MTNFVKTFISSTSPHQPVRTGRMPPNFFSKVAPEIWVIILEFIDPVEEREDLQSASLSCRTLAYPGQYILFRYLKLSGDQHLQSMPLGSADKYARCARHLCIRDFHGSKRSSWPGPLDNLVQILSLCSGLVDISIRSYYEASETAGIPRSSRGSLLSVSRRRETEPLFRSLSSVHTITIDENTATRTVDYPYFLNCFPQLQKLIAIDLTHGTPLISGNDAFPAFSLDSLSLMYVYDMPFLNWLSPALGDLKYLSITRGTAFEITGDDFNGHEFIITSGHILDTFKLWLRGIGQSVVHLTLDVSDSARWGGSRVQCDLKYDH